MPHHNRDHSRESFPPLQPDSDRLVRAAEQGITLPYMIDFLRAGDSNGDAIVVKYGDTKDGNFFLQVIDGGFTDTGDQIIAHFKQNFIEKAKIADMV